MQIREMITVLLTRTPLIGFLLLNHNIPAGILTPRVQNNMCPFFEETSGRWFLCANTQQRLPGILCHPHHVLCG